MHSQSCIIEKARDAKWREMCVLFQWNFDLLCEIKILKCIQNLENVWLKIDFFIENSPTLSCLNKFDQKDMTCLMHQRLSYNAIKFKSLTNFSFLFLLLLLPQKYCLRDES